VLNLIEGAHTSGLSIFWGNGIGGPLEIRVFDSASLKVLKVLNMLNGERLSISYFVSLLSG